jgi:Abortive infection C-terminus
MQGKPQELLALDDTDLELLPASAREAIQIAIERVDRASSARDVEAIVGGSKELIETVAKAVLDSLGTAYGSNARLATLTGQTLGALKLDPVAIQGRPSLAKLSSSVQSAVQAVAELRNTDGTGHGRATRSNLDLSHADFVQAVALAWCKWILATSRRALGKRGGLDKALADIGGAEVFSRGRLAAYLADLDMTDLAEEDQRRLGLAVARRWTVNQTWMPVEDVIQPLAEGKADYPAAFREGIFEGLLLDNNGYLRTTSDDVGRAVQVGLRLPGDRIEKAFRTLADRVDDATPSQTLDEKARDEVQGRLRALAAEQTLPFVRQALDRLDHRLEKL